jgi:TP901 family phage tail tape measure protein
MSNTPGGMPPLNVQIRISTTGAGSAASAMRTVSGASSAMGSSIAGSAVPIRMMGDAMRQTASLIKYSVIGGFVNMGKSAMDASRQMEVSMSKIQGLVGTSAVEVERMRQSILELGGSTLKSPLELSEALYFITSSGFDGAEAMDILAESARAAAAGLGETEVIADALTSILSAYGEGTYSAAKASDILTVAVREGKAEADQFAPALGKVLPVAAAFGASFEDVSAGVAALSRTGASAGTSAIYLRQVLSQLLKPSKQAADTMKAVGTSAESIRTQISEEGLLAALEGLNARLGGSEYEIASSGLAKVFGNVRALTAVYSLLGPNLEANRGIFEEMTNSAGAAADAFEIASETADAKFRAALGNLQAMMIRLGDSIMPVVADLVEFGGAIVGGVNAIVAFTGKLGPLGSVLGRITKYFIAVTAVAFLFAKSALFVFTRGAALLRLFANMQIVLKGFTTGTRHASGTTRALGTSLQFSSASMTKNVGLTNLLTAQTYQGVISEKAFYNSIAATTSNQHLKAAALAKSATATGTLTASNQGLAFSELVAAVNAKVLGRALMSMIPVIGVVVTVGMLAMDIFKGLFGKKKSKEETDGIDDRAKSLSELNEILGVTVRLATSGFTLEVKTEGNEDGESPFERFKKTIPQDFADAVEEINKSTAKPFERAAFGAGFLAQFEGLSDKEKGIFAGYLSNLLAVDAKDILNIDTSKTGSILSAAVDGIFQQAFQGSDTKYKDEVLSVVGDPLITAEKQLSALFGNIAKANNEGGAIEDTIEILRGAGEGVGNLVDETGDVVSFARSMSLIRAKMVAAGAGVGYINKFLGEYQSAVLQSITTTTDFTKDSTDLQTAFKNTDNLTGFAQILQKSGVSAAQAEVAVQELYEAYNTDEVIYASEQLDIFNRVINKYAVEANDAEQAQKDLMSSAYDLGAEFGDGLSPAIRDLANEYEDAKKAMDNFGKGQDAIKGRAVDLDDASVDYRDSLRGLNEALKDSGGSIDNSALGDKAKGAIKDVQESILDYVNAYQVANPGATVEEVSNVARQKLIQGYSAVKDVFQRTGVDIQKGNEYLNSIKFDFTGTGVLEDYISTYFGANTDMEQLAKDVAPELPKATIDAIASGIVADGGAAAAAAAPGVKAMGAAILQQFKDYFQIKSPSQLMKKEIGFKIIDGIVVGVEETSARIRDAINGIKISSELPLEQKLMLFRRGEKMAAAVVAGVEGDETAVVDVIGNGFTPNDTSSKTGGGSKKDTPAEMRGTAFRQGQQYGRFFNKGITRGLAEKFLEQKGKITTPIMDLIEKVIGDASSALGTIGKYIDAQLSFQKALSENLKLANQQMLLQSNVAKAERDASFARRKFGSEGGAAVTDYEIAQIEDLQKTLEKVTRDYAMRRTDIRAVIDAENALREAQAASVEVSKDVIGADNAVIDANLALATSGLEASKSIYDIVEAQGKLNEAAIDFRINGRQAVSVFEKFANQALPGLAYQVDQATGVMYKAGVALTDDNGLFLKSIKGLGEAVFNALAEGANEARAASTVPEFFQKASPIMSPPSSSGAAEAMSRYVPTQAERANKNSPFFGQKEDGSLYAGFRDAVLALHPNYRLGTEHTLQEAKSDFRNLYDLYLKNNRVKMAMGGLVTRPTLATIGESGPELVVPLNGAGVTTALERLSAVRSLNTETKSGGREQIFNITVNNPVPETASESISRRMRSLSTAGMFG